MSGLPLTGMLSIDDRIEDYRDFRVLLGAIAVQVGLDLHIALSLPGRDIRMSCPLFFYIYYCIMG